MDERLAERYALLFEGYGAGAPRSIVEVKARIARWIARQDGRVRSDAAYFLIVTCDHMIYRAHGGYVPGAPPWAGDRSVEEPMLRATELLLGALAQEDGEISAHRVMQVIDRSWPELQKIFPWG